ncbi:MAG: hypothetical protein OXC62_17810 [Aestuariivita sp.]|nr:hypothetical protein [Aestuariivita sp.]
MPSSTRLTHASRLLKDILSTTTPIMLVRSVGSLGRKNTTQHGERHWESQTGIPTGNLSSAPRALSVLL